MTKQRIKVGQTWRDANGATFDIVRIRKVEGVTLVTCRGVDGGTFDVPFADLRDSGSYAHVRDRSGLVYRYGLLAPIEGREALEAQLREAHAYRNALVEHERARRAKVRELDGSVAALDDSRAAVLAAKTELAEARKALRAARASVRSWSVDPELVERVEAAKAAHKAAVEAARAGRERPETIAAIAALKPAKAAASAEATAAGVAAYKAGSLYWGTRKLVDDAAAKSFETTPLYRQNEPLDPRFVPFRGEGSVGVQVHQKGAGGTGFSAHEIMSGEGGAAEWLTIGERPEAERPAPRSAKVAAARARNAARRAEALAAGGGRRAERLLLRMRIGTDEAGAPVMAAWPIVMHRPLPPGAIVRRAAVTVRRIGPREEWSLVLTLDGSTVPLATRDEGARGTVAVSIGWFSTESGIRAASWVDDRGDAEHYVLSDAEGRKERGRLRHAGVVSALRKADELRSVRDQNFNEARGVLVTWLRTVEMPEWMRRATVRRSEETPTVAQALAYLGSWRSPKRLSRLAREWATSRFAGDEGAFAALESWRYHDHHLWHWEASQRKGAERRRRDEYRVLAATLARRYERLVVADEAYDDLARRPQAEGPRTIAAANAARQLVAPGDLRLILTQAFARRGGQVVTVKSAGIATTCPACGSTDAAQRDSSEHDLVCVSCTFHRELSTARCLNMLRSAGLDREVGEIIESGKELGEHLKRMASDEAAE